MNHLDDLQFKGKLKQDSSLWISQKLEGEAGGSSPASTSSPMSDGETDRIIQEELRAQEKASEAF